MTDESKTEELMSEEPVEKVESKDSDLELEQARKNLEEMTKKYTYLAAELDNTNRRFERERVNLLKFGNEKLLKDLLDVVDNFERTIEAIGSDSDEKIQNIVTGIEMVKKQFVESLGKFGLEPVEAIGKEFDPNFHEAIGKEMKEKAKDEEVIKEYQKGYILNGRLLRASKVIVNKK